MSSLAGNEPTLPSDTALRATLDYNWRTRNVDLRVLFNLDTTHLTVR